MILGREVNTFPAILPAQIFTKDPYVFHRELAKGLFPSLVLKAEGAELHGKHLSVYAEVSFLVGLEAEE